MAYLDRKHRVVILYPPKTGSHTIRKLINDSGRVADVQPMVYATSHPTLDQMAAWWNTNTENVYEYDVYAFYREPVEKFLSFVAYNYKTYLHMKPTSNVFEYVEKYGMFVPQVRWLKHPKTDVKLLDFRNFDAEITKLLTSIGIPVPPTVPRVNVSGNRKTPADLTAEETAFIKNMYREDYEFFESKGITF